jgi:hypothetical protein
MACTRRRGSEVERNVEFDSAPRDVRRGSQSAVLPVKSRRMASAGGAVDSEGRYAAFDSAASPAMAKQTEPANELRSPSNLGGSERDLRRLAIVADGLRPHGGAGTKAGSKSAEIRKVMLEADRALQIGARFPMYDS